MGQQLITFAFLTFLQEAFTPYIMAHSLKLTNHFGACVDMVLWPSD